MNGKITEKRWFIYALVPVCALCWGFSYLGTSVTLEYLEPIQLLAVRWTVAAALFLILAALKVIKVRYRGKKIRKVLLVGACQPCAYAIFETLGIKYTTTSESSIFLATVPLMVLLVGGLFLHKKNSLRTKLSIFIALCGVITCIVFSPTFSLSARGTGYLFLLVAVLCGTLYSYTSNWASSEFDAVEVTVTLSVMGCIFFNILNFAGGYGFSGYAACVSDWHIMAGILFLGSCCSCLCFLIFNFVLGKLPTAIGTNLVSNSTTAVGVLSGCILAGDPFGWYTVAGVAMTITGVCLSSTGKKAE